MVDMSNQFIGFINQRISVGAAPGRDGWERWGFGWGVGMGLGMVEIDEIKHNIVLMYLNLNCTLSVYLFGETTEQGKTDGLPSQESHYTTIVNNKII